MSQLMAEWRARRAREDQQLHDQLRAALAGGRVAIYADPRMLDYQGSPVHSPWDHLGPLLVLMTLALVILLSAGLIYGIGAMLVGVLYHLYGNRYLVAWRMKRRSTAYMMLGAPQWNQIWALGGVAMVLKDSAEQPCFAPKGDWRKFVRRNLPGEEVPEAGPAPELEAPAGAAPAAPVQEILP